MAFIEKYNFKSCFEPFTWKDNTLYPIRIWQECNGKDLNYLIGKRVTIDGAVCVVTGLDKICMPYTKDMVFSIATDMTQDEWEKNRVHI